MKDLFNKNFISDLFAGGLAMHASMIARKMLSEGLAEYGREQLKQYDNLTWLNKQEDIIGVAPDGCWPKVQANQTCVLIDIPLFCRDTKDIDEFRCEEGDWFLGVIDQAIKTLAFACKTNTHVYSFDLCYDLMREPFSAAFTVWTHYGIYTQEEAEGEGEHSLRKAVEYHWFYNDATPEVVDEAVSTAFEKVHPTSADKKRARQKYEER